MNLKTNLKNKIFENPQNKAVIDFFQLKNTSNSLKNWVEIEIAFDSEITFFENYAEDLPATSKYH